MRYFLTGGTGFIGSWVARELVERGKEVRCLVRASSNLRWLEELPVEYHRGSLLDRQSLTSGLEGVDYVLHIAGTTKALSKRDYYRGNVEATGNLMEAVKYANPGIRKIVHISSQAAVGPSPSPEPLDEDSPARPMTDYGRSKLQSEVLVREYMEILPVTILRPPAVYGPRDSDIFEVFKNVSRGWNLKVGHIDPLVSIIQVADLARGILLAAEHQKSSGETYFIANEAPAAWSEVIDILRQLMNKKVRHLSLPYPLAYLAGAVMEGFGQLRKVPTILNRQKIREISAPYWVISSRKIREQLGFTARLSLKEGLQQTLAWYKEVGWL